jgi:hypothetical protein
MLFLASIASGAKTMMTSNINEHRGHPTFSRLLAYQVGFARISIDGHYLLPYTPCSKDRCYVEGRRGIDKIVR